MKNYILATFFIVMYSAVAQSQTEKIWNINDLKVYDNFDDMEFIFQKDNDTTYLINFWATWCVPCVKELPFIDPLTNHFKDQKVKVILVSLDFEEKIKSKLMPFLARKKIISEVLVLTDTNYNKWIEKVNPGWSGAIPVTVVYKGKDKYFYEKEFHSIKEVINIIDKVKDKN